MTLAHIAGFPIEESLATLAPAAGVVGLLVGARLRGLAAWLRLRKSDRE
jgi:hypothetical protein